MIKQNRIFHDVLDRIDSVAYRMDPDEVTTILEITMPEGEYYYSDEIQDLYQELTDRVNDHISIHCTTYYWIDALDLWYMLIVENSKLSFNV